MSSAVNHILKTGEQLIHCRVLRHYRELLTDSLVNFEAVTYV